MKPAAPLGLGLYGAGLLLAGLCGSALATATPAATPDQPKPTPATRTTLVCEAVYLPARTPWTRTVRIDFDAQRVRAVHIDGVPVYSFAVHDTVIWTALDNERIQIDTAAPSWTSDFRGAATAQGRCERQAQP
jgi:hypothetical protein